MIRTHSEERTLLSWLTMQEKVLRLWIEEALSAAPRDSAFVADLESHHDWLAAQIEALKKQRAA
jgi:hypothetical protein